MKFIFLLLGFAVGGLLGYPLAQVSLTLTAIVTGLGCLVGFEIGIRLKARLVDPDIRALVTPTPTAYGWIMGTVCGSVPVLVFATGLIRSVQVPDLGVWVAVSLLLGPLALFAAPVLYVAFLAFLGAFLGRRFGVRMNRRFLSGDDEEMS